jgi:hypothetical protein
MRGSFLAHHQSHDPFSTHNAMAEEDPWAAFGDDGESDSDSGDDTATVDHVGSFLTSYFRKISKVQRVVNSPLHSTDPHLFHMSDRGPYDAFIVATTPSTSDEEALSNRFSFINDDVVDTIVPGGLLVFDKKAALACCCCFDEHVWEDAKAIFGDTVYRRLRPTQIAHETARWHKPKNLKAERDRVSVVALSAKERAVHRILDEATVNAAAALIHQTGYCILTGLEDAAACRDYGQNVVLSDLHTAASILLNKPNGQSVDLYHPCDSLNDPSVYKELSMREDCRMDLRDGPQLRTRRLRDNEVPLWNHQDIVKIITRVMNPEPSTAANYGRMNFDGQTRPRVVTGAVGGIVTLPGAADQAIHADTPHLYEHLHLPAHYINAFTLGCPPVDNVGQTAFIHGSHRIDFVAQFIRSDAADLDARVYDSMVRPRMNLGDVVLFDCRILHFGLGNASKDTERPMLYCNFTQPWFHDRKNWDDQASVFS